MFGKRKATVEATVEATVQTKIQVAMPEAKTITTSKEQLQSAITYVNKAHLLDLVNPAIAGLALRIKFIKCGVLKYDYNSVYKFLRSIEPSDRRFNWSPIRTNDAFDNHTQPYKDSSGHLLGTDYVYEREIPAEALNIIDRLKETEPLIPTNKRMRFFISDYVAAKPDPFLLVTCFGNIDRDAFVIYHWDEPGFDILPSLEAL